MKTLKFKSLQQFAKEYDLSRINKNTLLISDIDGVFFKGIFDPREILGTIHPNVLKAFEKLLSTKAKCWIFTNRMKLFKKFPYIKQITRSIKKITSTTPKFFENCSEFLQNNLPNFAIIMNANKPEEESLKVVEKGTANFSTVIYLGSQDLPFYHNDLRLVQKLSQRINTSNLIYIEISSWKRNSPSE
jgi:hypothetical protein